MAIDISYISSYRYSIDTAGLNTNIKLVLDNASQKNIQENNLEQNLNNTNSALLAEYNRSIAKSNIAQQIVLDNNLKETLKFLNSQAAKQISKPKKVSDIIEEILSESETEGYNKDEPRDNEYTDDLEDFDIKIDSSIINIFAA